MKQMGEMDNWGGGVGEWQKLIPGHMYKISNRYRTEIIKDLSDVRPLILRKDAPERYGKQIIHCLRWFYPTCNISINTVHLSTVWNDIHQYSPFVHYLEILHDGFCNGYSTPVLPNYYIKLNQCACKRRNIHEEKNKVKVRNKVAGIKIIWHFQWVGMCFHGFWLGLLLLEITFW